MPEIHIARDDAPTSRESPMSMFRSAVRGVLAGVTAAWIGAAGAQSPDARRQAVETAAIAAQAVMVHGPRDVKLADQAVLKLPADMTYIPQPEAGRLMEAMGNTR